MHSNLTAYVSVNTHGGFLMKDGIKRAVSFVVVLLHHDASCGLIIVITAL